MRQSIFAVLLAAALLPCAAAAAPHAWPSLERQLAVDRVAPETPLAKLIADNQDFQMLRPEEATDHNPIPLWLRVYWRKAHPEGIYSATDPTGGYPLVLRELHEWFVSHPDLHDTPHLEAAAAADKAHGHPQPKPPVVSSTGPEQRISGDVAYPRSESDIRANVWDPGKVIGASNDIEGFGSLAIFYSQDGGGSWGTTSLPKVRADTFHSDPAVDWTSDGTAWAATLAVDGGARRLEAQVFRSDNGGTSWTFDSNVSGDQGEVDKEMMWVDHSESSPFKDNIYLVWHNGPTVFTTVRNGSGWAAPLQVSGGETTGTGIGADIKANKIGQVIAFWPDTGSHKLYATHSTNGGASYSRPVTIAPTFSSFDIGIPAQGRRRVLIYVTGGTFYRGPRQNMVYAAWNDLSGARGCHTDFDEPGFTQSSPCTMRVFFASSSDGGSHWGRPVMLNNQHALNDQFNPWLAVDADSGAIAIAYYDTIGQPRNKTNLWAQASFNDGVTWSAPYQVTSVESDESIGLADANQYGDYNGMSAANGTFFPSWTDRRNHHEEIWTAPLIAQLPGRTVSRLSHASAGAAGPVCPFRFLFESAAETVASGWTPERLAQRSCQQP